MSKKEKWEIIAHEYVVSLFPVFMMADAFYDKMKRVVGVNIDFAEIISNNSGSYYIKPKSWRQGHHFLVSKIRKNSDFLKKVFHAVDIKGRVQIRFSKKLTGLNLAALTNARLNDYYQRYCRLNTDLYSYGLLLPLLDFQRTTFLSDEVTRFLKEKRAEKYFSILTTPLSDTFNKLQELNLLDILKQIKAKPKILALFKDWESNQIIEALPNKDKKIWQQIRTHTKEYAWVYYVYEGPAADEAYFIDIIRDFVRRKVNPNLEIAKHKKEKLELKNKQAAIISKLKPDDYYRSIIEMARDAVYFKIYRRDLQTQSYYFMERVLSEIARRLNLSLKQVRMMVAGEVEAALSKGKVNIDNINQRMKLAIYLRQNSAKRVLVSQAAKAFFDDIKQEKKVNANVKEIKGTTAQPGKVRGVVKLINSPDEMSKMNQGDILVSASTNPNLMPAIRKAAAIVTDEGGLTCHAAIVSREFKIPCVVGTNIATKVLKDGDKVEVDATKGIVKKL